ncbi:MAG: subclass B3 metallo-beta-lactamase [Verrucomicrobiota bacterium]
MRTPRLVSLLAGVALLADAPAAPELPASPTREWVVRLFESWKAPVPPRHLGGNRYYVGASGVSSWLITTPAGHILLDTGFEDTVPHIQRGVEQLGFKLADIRLILSSHAHIDHVGGHARMKTLTGAQVLASAADARTLESGGTDDYIQWPKESILYKPVKVDRIIADGEKVALGGTALTAHLTPGHTRGATTWTMELAEGGRTYHVVFFSSATVNDGTRLVKNPDFPEIAAAFEASFARFKALRCDIFLAPHGGQFAMAEKFARLDRGDGVAAFVDPEGWRQLVAGAEKNFREILARETILQKP